MYFFPFKLLLCFICGISAVRAEFDYTKIDYCTKEMHCDIDGTVYDNTNCGCKDNPNIREFTTDHNNFRQRMVDFHNFIRNYVASGHEMNKSMNFEGSNMNVLNYDLELEHGSRCWLHGKDGPSTDIHTHDKCRKATSCGPDKTGQNLQWRGDDFFIKDVKTVHVALQRFQDEVLIMEPSIIDKYRPSDPGVHWGHYTQMHWATATHVGCARGCKTGKNPKNSITQFCVLVCEYCSRMEGELMNCIGEPVYLRGKPCSACPAGKKCNSKYPSLCGELEPVPQDALKPLPGGAPIPTSAPGTTEGDGVTSGGGGAEGGVSGGGAAEGGNAAGGGATAGNTSTAAADVVTSSTNRTTKSNANIQHPCLQMYLLSIVFVCLRCHSFWPFNHH